MNKPWHKSKTLWLNAVAILAIVLQWAIGVELISVEAQAAILAVANVLLRTITNTGVTK